MRLPNARSTLAWIQYLHGKTHQCCTHAYNVVCVHRAHACIAHVTVVAGGRTSRRSAPAAAAQAGRPGARRPAAADAARPPPAPSPGPAARCAP
jgi:hypothetical protein